MKLVAPEKIFKNRRAQPLSGAEVTTYLTTKVKEVKGKGIFTYYQGIKIPRVGVSPTYEDFPMAMAEIDKVKRVLREYLKNPFLLFRPEKTLREFNLFADKCLGQWYLDEKYWCPATWQICRFILWTLMDLEIDGDVCVKTAEIVATLFEYDDAYRYRLNDLMSETTQEAMIRNPRKEIKRLLEIINTRDSVKEKTGKVGRLISFLLLIPKVKRAMIRGLEAVDWQGWQLTESEIFHTLLWDGYDVQGKKEDERLAYYNALFRGKKKPQQVHITLK
jgi:hypothetical protein